MAKEGGREMKAEELMLFDLVKRKKDGKVMTVVELRYAETIAAITSEDVYYGDMEDYHESEIEPIPLTTEILEKNGFENDFYEDVSVADYHSIRVEGYSLKGKVDGWDGFLITFCNGRGDVVTDFHGEFRGEIGYVHTFQHALRLCGINLEIKI